MQQLASCSGRGVAAPRPCVLPGQAFRAVGVARGPASHRHAPTGAPRSSVTLQASTGQSQLQPQSTSASRSYSPSRTAIVSDPSLALPIPGTNSALPVPPSPTEDPTWRNAERTRRLVTLVETRRLYRNCIRAQYLLGTQTPLYTPPPPPPPPEPSTETEGSAGTDADGASARAVPASPSPSPSPEEEAALKAAVDAAAEMALVSEQLKASLRALPAGFGTLIFAPGSGPGAEQRVRETARGFALALRERLGAELQHFPIPAEAVQHQMDQRNARFSRRVLPEEPGQGKQGAGAAGGGGAAAGAAGAGADQGVAGQSGEGEPWSRGPLERLEAAERAAGELIAKKIKPALKKASEKDPLEVLRDTGSFLRGFWVRLNGGSPAGMAAARAGLDLPLPVGSTQRSELVLSQLSLELEGLEKKLQEASKNRENKLRKAGLQDRVQMAIQLKGLDAEVLAISSRLAVRTLQLELEHVYDSLEAEALDFFSGVRPGGLLARDGSTAELSLLVAEFTLLEEQLALLAAAVEGAGAGAAIGAGSGGGMLVAASPAGARAAAEAAAAGMMLSDELLGRLAVDIPDMRSRVGVADQTVFGGQGFSITKARLQLKESMETVKEAINFLARGFKLLGSDMGGSTKMIVKAALGNSLKPREVSALRRTARDLLTFIPFTIILIIPLSPLGHVLVFGFIQRYFPSFFPSQFSSRRQEIMVRYEELERQLLEAQATAEAAEDEVELARAREAVARLTAPEGGGGGGSGFGSPLASTSGAGGGGGGGGPEAGGGGMAAGGSSGVGSTVVAAAAAAALNGGAAAGAAGGSSGAATEAGSGGVKRPLGAAAQRVAAAGPSPGGSPGAAAAAGGGAAAAAAAAGGSAFAAGFGLGGSGSISGATLSSVDEVVLQEATQKIRLLSERMEDMRDADMADPAAEGEGGPGGPPGRH
ncbi:hypothetical protein HYH03_016155 [Edaphochlamys debaryana]|uniref:Letm1 RBD domain-containing protein n=1 Tax=Edaphochlamys debaryana TaxID=47281 RepID=A0A835XI11_9CHLO|nr:hypothetical protein HYH03_016155 [Edaphochlamys debaryana]|eukprot:KAG2485057.1 hypothetical protein HYH03_016155 [Edaphochlamys debaryana]